ncbi:hypothetical protein ABPG74_000482 [Tetrahymena malaccensis]
MKIFVILAIITLVTVSASQKTQCLNDLLSQKVCDQYDSNCNTALTQFSKCQDECELQNKIFQQVITCIQKSCSSSNILIESYSLKLQKCMLISDQNPSENKCGKEEMKKQIENTCDQGDTDCIQAQVSLSNCLENCQQTSKNDFDQNIKCAQKNCQSNNPKVQALLDTIISCLQQSRSNNPKIIFSLITLLVLSLSII